MSKTTGCKKSRLIPFLVCYNNKKLRYGLRKVLYILIGSIFLAIGFIGIVVPGLPTTPFLLISAACYVRSSQRLYNWLLDHRLFGAYIRTFREKRALTMRVKIISIVSMCVMISLSVFFFIHNEFVRIIVIIAGIIGAITICGIKTLKEEESVN